MLLTILIIIYILGLLISYKQRFTLIGVIFWPITVVIFFLLIIGGGLSDGY